MAAALTAPMVPIRVLAQRYELVAVADGRVQEHPANARRGDEEFIDESLQANGFFGACVVDERTGYVLVGNHRWRRTVRTGTPHVPILWVTPDDDAHARRIMLADNRANDRASYDLAQLAKLLEEAKASDAGLPGTGYTEAALDALLAQIATLPSPGGGAGGGPAGDGEADPKRGPNLQERFGVPPFSVLDARQGYWQARKREWIAIGIRSELGRGSDTTWGIGPRGDSTDGTGKQWTEDEGRRPKAVPGGAKFPADKIGPDGKFARRDHHMGEAGRARATAEAFDVAGRTDPSQAPAAWQKKARGGADVHPATVGAGGLSDQVAPRAWKGSPNSLADRVERAGGGAGTSDAAIANVVRPGAKKHQAGKGVLSQATERAGYGADYDTANGENAWGGSGTSIFDPVLCELAYRWFCPPGGRVLDPFAGGSVRGIVAALLGRHYEGVELRGEQVEANRGQWDAISVRFPKAAPPAWHVGDSREVVPTIATPVDFVLSCPPYADLEVYSDDPRDISTMPYDAFVEAYRAIIAASVARLADDRFAMFVVGEVRGPKGHYRGFVRDTVAAFEDAGARFYNEAVLITAVGSMPVRAGRTFSASRKLCKGHQTVLVFLKGDEARAVKALGEVEIALALPGVVAELDGEAGEDGAAPTPLPGTEILEGMGDVAPPGTL